MNGRSRDVIMEDMQRRIDRADAQTEKQDAIKVRLCPFLEDDTFQTGELRFCPAKPESIFCVKVAKLTFSSSGHV